MLPALLVMMELLALLSPSKNNAVAGPEVGDGGSAGVARISKDDLSAASGRVAKHGVVGGAGTLEVDGPWTNIIRDNGAASVAVDEIDRPAVFIFKNGTTGGTAIKHDYSTSIAVADRIVACGTVIER